jgi:hypothetical protein
MRKPFITIGVVAQVLMTKETANYSIKGGCKN